MNDILDKFARDWLKEHCNMLTIYQQHKFKCMYSHRDLNKDIYLVVDDMPSEQLDWAMQQVINTEKNKNDKS